MDNDAIPWVPIDGIPESPCGIEVSGGPEEVTVRAVYSFYGGNRDLLITLQAEVFGCFSEISGPPVALSADYPRITDPRRDAEDPHWRDYHIWPLMEVRNSTWLGYYQDRLWSPGQSYRHYSVVSDDGCFHALAWEPPLARWTAGKH